MATSARINRIAGRDQAVIGDHLLDDAHMTWLAAGVESERALRASFDAGAPQGAGARRIPRSGRPEQAAARDPQGLCELAVTTVVLGDAADSDNNGGPSDGDGTV